jgi:nitrate reductase NapAB chaperone NapD
MPVFSYLAYPKHGEKAALLRELSAMDGCEVVPAENEDMLLLVTDTPNARAEEVLQEKLNRLKTLQSLGMAFGHTGA